MDVDPHWINENSPRIGWLVTSVKLKQLTKADWIEARWLFEMWWVNWRNTSAIFEAEVGETPNVSETDGDADAGEEEIQLIGPSSTFVGLIFLFLNGFLISIASYFATNLDDNDLVLIVRERRLFDVAIGDWNAFLVQFETFVNATVVLHDRRMNCDFSTGCNGHLVSLRVDRWCCAYYRCGDANSTDNFHLLWSGCRQSATAGDIPVGGLTSSLTHQQKEAKEKKEWKKKKWFLSVTPPTGELKFQIWTGTIRDSVPNLECFVESQWGPRRPSPRGWWLSNHSRQVFFTWRSSHTRQTHIFPRKYDAKYSQSVTESQIVDNIYVLILFHAVRPFKFHSIQ